MIEFLFLLFVKHYIVDFVLQTDEMIEGKGIYGNRYGILHSAQHGIGTFLAAFAMITQPLYWFILPVIDFIVHYHVDYIKRKYGCRDISKKEFWNHLGLDQLAHYVTYLFLVVL